MSPKPNLVQVGVDWCCAHDGIRNEDDDVCDMARRLKLYDECAFTPLWREEPETNTNEQLEAACRELRDRVDRASACIDHILQYLSITDSIALRNDLMITTRILRSDQ